MHPGKCVATSGRGCGEDKLHSTVLPATACVQLSDIVAEMFRRVAARAASSSSRVPGDSCRPAAPSLSRPRAHFRVIFVSCEPNTTSARPFTQSARADLAAPWSTSRLRVSDVVSVEYRHAIKEASDPMVWKASPNPLTQDFARHQVSLQQRSHFHSSSVPAFAFTMVSQVNKTNLHPSGIT